MSDLVEPTCLTVDRRGNLYVFDAGKVRLADLLAEASAQREVLDVETHRPPIDDVIADIYQAWLREGHAPGSAAAVGPRPRAAAGRD